MFKDQRSVYYDLIIIHLIIVYVHGLHCKYHTRMKMNKSSFQINMTCVEIE